MKQNQTVTHSQALAKILESKKRKLNETNLEQAPVSNNNNKRFKLNNTDSAKVNSSVKISTFNKGFSHKPTQNKLTDSKGVLPKTSSKSAIPYKSVEGFIKPADHY